MFNKIKEKNKNNDKKKVTLAVYILLRVIVFGILIINALNKNYENVFTCTLTLILFFLPFFIEKKFKVEIPDMLEIIMFFFIFCAEILGELSSFFTLIPFWDTMLHTINGFIMGAIGLSMIELLNNSESVAMKLSPIFVALVSLCFSMTIGVFWEFFEYGVDKIFDTDMQKDTIIEKISSVTFDPDGLNKIHTIEIESVEVNGEDFVQKYGGYIDIGLNDTMEDLIVNFIGAFVFSLIGYFYSKSNDNKIKKILIVPKRENSLS